MGEWAGERMTDGQKDDRWPAVDNDYAVCRTWRQILS